MKRISTVRDGRFVGTVVRDTREQTGYGFASLTCDQADGGGPLIVPVEVGTLRSGDYSLRGYEDQVAVERKSLPDLFGTLGQGRERFERELERLAAFRFAAVVVEATLPEVLLSPPRNSDLNPKTVVRSVLAWQQRVPNVHWWFAGPRPLAEALTFRVLDRFLKERLRESDPST